MSHGCDALSRGNAPPEGFPLQPSARSRHIPQGRGCCRSPRPQIFVPSWPFSAPFPAVIGTSVRPTLTSSGCGDPSRSWAASSLLSPCVGSCPAPHPARERDRAAQSRRCGAFMAAPGRPGLIQPCSIRLTPAGPPPCPILSPAVDIPAGSSRALAAPPSPEHPHIPEPRQPGGTPVPTARSR